MQSIRIHAFGGPEVLTAESIDDPVPGPGEVRIRVHAIGVNPVETYVRAGAYGPRPFPFTPGTDCAGVVDAVGPDVTAFAAGQRVYTAGTVSGAYAEKAIATTTQVHPLPPTLDFEQGAAIGIPYATAWRSLVDIARTGPGAWVLVHGASGGVGIAAVQIAKHLGAHVVGTAGSDAGAALVGALGADHCLRHDHDGYREAALSCTPQGTGFQTIVEMAAHRNLGADTALLARGGRVVVVGSRGPVEVNARELMLRDASVHGMLLFNTPAEELSEIHARLGDCFTRGVLPPVIARRFPLADAAEAHRRVLEPGATGKLVLLP